MVVVIRLFSFAFSLLFFVASTAVKTFSMFEALLMRRKSIGVSVINFFYSARALETA